MIAESNYAVVIATFGDRLKNLAPISQPLKQDQNQLHLSRALIKLRVIARN